MTDYAKNFVAAARYVGTLDIPPATAIQIEITGNDIDVNVFTYFTTVQQDMMLALSAVPGPDRVDGWEDYGISSMSHAVVIPGADLPGNFILFPARGKHGTEQRRDAILEFVTQEA